MTATAATGVLLINLGTPDDTSVPAVRRYLDEFLSDPMVIDINPIARWMLLNFIILRTRPQKSAAAYATIWDERGSPLRYHSEDLRDGVARVLGDDFEVALAMRYGNPSIASALASLRARGCTHIVVMPLYPQFTMSSTITSHDEVRRQVAQMQNPPELRFVPAFYDDEGFISAFAELGEGTMAEHPPDHVLFSFHGLPERHITKCANEGSQCLTRPDCCDRIEDRNRDCYKAQCYATARALAQRHQLADDRWSVAFQSRLGRTKWIEPYTDHVVVELARRGIRKLVVYCPAFVADCLETLEEVAMRERESFREAGGEELHLVPSLNATDAWCNSVARMVRAHSPNQ